MSFRGRSLLPIDRHAGSQSLTPELRNPQPLTATLVPEEAGHAELLAGRGGVRPQSIDKPFQNGRTAVWFGSFFP